MTNKGQALIEFALVCIFIFVFILAGLPFLYRYNKTKIIQMIELRRIMFSKSEEPSGDNIILDSIDSFLSNVAFGTTVSSGEKSVKIPRAFREFFNKKKEIKVKSSITILRGSWNTDEFVSILKNTRFGRETVNELEGIGKNSDDFIKSF